MKISIHCIFLILGGLFLALLIVRLGPEQIVSLLIEMGWGLPIVCLIYSICALSRILALRNCFEEPGKVSFGEVTLIYIAGEGVKNLTSGGPLLSEPFKAFLLQNKGIGREESFGAVLGECWAHKITSAGIAIIGLILFINLFQPSASFRTASIIGILALAVFLALSWIVLRSGKCLLSRALDWVFRVRTRRAPTFQSVRQVEMLLHRLCVERLRRGIKIVLFETSAQCFLLFELWWMLLILDESIPILIPLLLETISKITHVAFFFVPMQIGASEGLFTAAGHVLGLTAAVGFSLSLLRRLRSLCFAVLGLAVFSTQFRDPGRIRTLR